jgi:hypothetical protein
MSKRYDRQAKPKPPEKQNLMDYTTPEDQEIERLQARVKVLEDALRCVIEEIDCGKQYDAADIARHALQEQSK